MGRFLGFLLIVAIALGVLYLGSPFYAVWRLTQAAKAGDAGAIAQAVDFPAVRSSLSPQLEAILQRQLTRERKKPKSLLDQLGMFVAPLFVPKAVDTLVTPEGVTWMLKTARPPHWSGPLKSERVTDRNAPGQPAIQRIGYMQDDLDQFQAVIGNRLCPGSSVSLKLLRRGFFTWKVVSLDLSGVTARCVSPRSAAAPDATPETSPDTTPDTTSEAAPTRGKAG